jgi:hypothetical protein
MRPDPIFIAVLFILAVMGIIVAAELWAAPYFDIRLAGDGAVTISTADMPKKIRASANTMIRVMAVYP